MKFYSSWVSSSKLTATFLPLHHSSIRRIAQTRDVFRYIAAKASKARHKRTRSKKGIEFVRLQEAATTARTTLTDFEV